MKKMMMIGCLLLSAVATFAQPGWTKNAPKSVFTLKTFAADGSLIASSNGFFTGTNGEAVSNFTPFKGAARAVVLDAQGKEWQVTGILGVNDMYDVVKFRVNNRKTQPLAVSQTAAPVGSTAWLLNYRDTKNVKNGPVRKAETFMGDYAYYTVAMTMSESQVSCPLLNDAGEVIGMMQQPASEKDTLSYAISARFVDSLKVTGVTYNDPALQLTQIKKELPADLKEATVVLYLSATQMDSAAYANLIQDFIQQFPSAPDGYIYRAQQEVGDGNFTAAEKDMETALKNSDQKDETYFTYARMIYNKEIYQSAQPYPNWSLDKALSLIQTANNGNPQPTYRQLEANIRFAQKDYNGAYAIFEELTKPYLKEAAPYLWARAEARRNAGKYRDAISDMNEYETLMTATVNDNFYYIRHQTEIQGRLYQQALNDINRAIQINPKEILYYAEKASLEIRVGMYDGAIATAQECIGIDANNSDGYLFLGLAQCLKGQKAEGIKNLEKAKSLGDTQADALIQKYQ